MYDRRGLVSRANTYADNYESNIINICAVGNIQQFWRYWQSIKPPSTLELNCNLHCFKRGIKPVWEDDQNRQGGKWTITFSSSHRDIVDQAWVFHCLIFMLIYSCDVCCRWLGRHWTTRTRFAGACIVSA